MDKEYVMRVAATIREQLVTMTDTPVLMSWGHRGVYGNSIQ